MVLPISGMPKITPTGQSVRHVVSLIMNDSARERRIAGQEDGECKVRCVCVSFFKGGSKQEPKETRQLYNILT